MWKVFSKQFSVANYTWILIMFYEWPGIFRSVFMFVWKVMLQGAALEALWMDPFIVSPSVCFPSTVFSPGFETTYKKVEIAGLCWDSLRENVLPLALGGHMLFWFVANIETLDPFSPSLSGNIGGPANHLPGTHPTGKLIHLKTYWGDGKNNLSSNSKKGIVFLLSISFCLG